MKMATLCMADQGQIKRLKKWGGGGGGSVWRWWAQLASAQYCRGLGTCSPREMILKFRTYESASEAIRDYKST